MLQVPNGPKDADTFLTMTFDMSFLKGEASVSPDIAFANRCAIHQGTQNIRGTFTILWFQQYHM